MGRASGNGVMRVCRRRGRKVYGPVSLALGLSSTGWRDLGRRLQLCRYSSGTGRRWRILRGILRRWVDEGGA